MKKSNFVAMIMGTVGGIFLALGMCMCLVAEWNAFGPGVIMGCVGLVVLLATLIVWRRLEGLAPIRLGARAIGLALLGIVGVLLLGVGMCLTMVWSQIVFGIIVGVIGIAVLLSLIPVVKGVR